MRRTIKEEFLRRTLFPLNNEQVSQGHRLAVEVALPFIDSLRAEGSDFIATLQAMTDQDVLDAALCRGLVHDAGTYFPRLPRLSSRGDCVNEEGRMYPNEIQIRALIGSLLKKSFESENSSGRPTLVLRDLSGGMSGAWVGVASVDGVECPLVIKAAPAEVIEEEVAGRRALADRIPRVKERLDLLEKINLEGASDVVMVSELPGASAERTAFRAMADIYVGPRKWNEIESCVDFLFGYSTTFAAVRLRMCTKFQCFKRIYVA